jgi:hypothetical protein
MKPSSSRLAPSLFLVLLLAACSLQNGSTPTPGTNIVPTIVASTLAAMTLTPQQSPLASPTIPTSTPLAPPTATQTLTQTFTPTSTVTAGPSPTITPTLKPSNTPIPDPGSIAGNITGYPYGSVPGLAIVAYGQEKPYYYSYIITGAGTTYYSMSSSYLIPGHFQVVAYDASGHAGGCTTLILVISNQTVNCDITNWGGSYPPKPASVPNP